MWWRLAECGQGLMKSVVLRRMNCSDSAAPPHLLDELRRLFKLVHPDLFHRFPQQKEINQRSFQLLQEYLSVAKGVQSSCSVPVYNFEFYVQQGIKNDHEEQSKGMNNVELHELKSKGMHLQDFYQRLQGMKSVESDHHQEQQHDNFHKESKGMKKVELSLPRPQITIHGAEMLPSTRNALSQLLSAFGLSSEFWGSLTGGDVNMNRVKLSDFFQQASEIQRQNETTVLGLEQKLVVVRNALRIGRGVTASFKKPLCNASLESQLQALYDLARALDSAPDVELRGSAIMFGDTCGVDGFGNLWLNHEDGVNFWVSFFKQVDVNSLIMRRTAHKERRVKEFRAARLMEVEMVFTDDANLLKPEYSTFLEKLADDAEAAGAVCDGKFHDLPIRVVESSELSIDNQMGYINVPVSESLSSIYKFIERSGREAVKIRMNFKAEEEKMVNLNLHVRQKLRMRHLAFDEQLDVDQIRSACMRLLHNASKLRVFTENLSVCISDQYKLPIEGTRSLMHLSWNFTMAQL